MKRFGGDHDLRLRLVRALQLPVDTTSSATTTGTYSYDASGNLACLSYPKVAGDTCSSPGSGTGVVAYAYNSEDEPTSLTDWAGNTLTFAYNTSGQACWS